MKERLHYLDGIKGLACLMVAACHYHALFGAAFWGADTLAARTDWFYNGPLCVRMFFLVSAFLLAVKVYRSEEQHMVQHTVIKRYLRLALPLLAVTLCIWVMEQAGVFHNMELTDLCQDPDYTGGYTEPHSFYQVFTTSLGTTLLSGDCSFNNKFWMMTWMFYGDILALIMALVTRCRRRAAFALFDVGIVLTLFTVQNLFPFMLGTALAYWYVHIRQEKKTEADSCRRNRVLSGIGWTLVFLGAALLIEFKGYLIVALDGVAERIPELGFLINGNTYNAIGILFLLLAVMHLPVLQRILGCVPLRKLGNVSYYVFLVHWPIMCSFSAGVFLHYRGMMADELLARILFCVTMGITILVSWIFTVTYERICTRVTKTVLDRV